MRWKWLCTGTTYNMPILEALLFLSDRSLSLEKLNCQQMVKGSNYNGRKSSYLNPYSHAITLYLKANDVNTKIIYARQPKHLLNVIASRGFLHPAIKWTLRKYDLFESKAIYL